MELTSAEKKVLSGISFNSESIMDGKLDAKEKSTLLEMRAVGEYLHAKYPSYKFEITSFTPPEGTVHDYTEWYYQAAPATDSILENSDPSDGSSPEPSRTFIARSKELSDTFQITDDFYGEVIRKELADRITDILTEKGFPVIRTTISFWEFLGEEYGESIPAEDVLTGKIKAGNDIKIFLDGSALKNPIHGSAASAVMRSASENAIFMTEKSLKAHAIVGDVYVVILKSQDSDPAKDRVCSDSFSL